MIHIIEDLPAVNRTCEPLALIDLYAQIVLPCAEPIDIVMSSMSMIVNGRDIVDGGTEYKHNGTARLLCAITLFAILAFAGVSKLNDPRPASEFLASLIYWTSTDAVRGVGAIEVVTALWLLSGIASATAGLVAAGMFASFGVAHMLALVQGVNESCGCMGKSDALARLSPEWWVGLCVVAVAMGLCLAWAPRAIAPGERRPRLQENP